MPPRHRKVLSGGQSAVPDDPFCASARPRSMTAAKVPAPPAGLGTKGARLWRSIVKDFAREEFVFDARELANLELACRQADDLDGLERALKTAGLVLTGSRGQPRLNGAVAEIRQGRLALARLLGELGLPDDDDDTPRTARSVRASHAARTRWARSRRATS